MNRIWRFIKEIFYYQRIIDLPLLQNINYNCASAQKRAIICYLTSGYSANWEELSNGRTQPMEIFKIVNTFNKLGYIVDIIGYNEIKALKYIEHNNYDLIFGFGESFYKLTELFPSAISILYMTENPPEFSFQEEMKRVQYFLKRHNRLYGIERSGKFYKIHHLQKKYSHVITMGESNLLADKYSNPYFIFPTGLLNPDFKFKQKNHLHARKHFIWFGSTGALHKGLDLLLDVFFQQNDIVLHICGLHKKDRKKLKIPRARNIVEYGHISTKSNIFIELIEKCTFIILPSCSEGCSTSITTGMLHGLIPIVIKDTGFNKLESNAIFLDDYDVDHIRTRLNEFSNFDAEKLGILSRQVFEFSRQNFTIQAFEYNFKNIMTDILKTGIS